MAEMLRAEQKRGEGEIIVLLALC
ncbi:protein of unknown function [Magnetospirillum sp. XM-1]|nr:protein of unknown function [Magnetospirillum sp. XM-1]